MIFKCKDGCMYYRYMKQLWKNDSEHSSNYSSKELSLVPCWLGLSKTDEQDCVFMCGCISEISEVNISL